MPSQQFCTFLLDGYLFGVPVPRVQELIRFQEMTRVPLAPEVVEGMINLRGQIVVAIDLRRRFALSERAEGELPINVVVRKLDARVPILMFSTLTERGASATLEALALGATDYLTKPSNTRHGGDIRNRDP